MLPILYFIIGVVMGVIVYLLIKQTKMESERTKPANQWASPLPQTTEHDEHGLARHNERREENKEAAKAKIMQLFITKKFIKNNDVEELLKVSDATATNYLQELEDEGKLKQINPGGRGVRYRKING